MTTPVKLSIIEEYGTTHQIIQATTNPDLIDSIYNAIVGHN